MRYCQFCHRVIRDIAPTDRLGGQYFCSNQHSMQFFRGEEYSPPPESTETAPFFPKTEGPRLNPTFADYPFPTKVVGMLGH